MAHHSKYFENPEPVHPWDRMSGETTRAYEAFRVYLGNEARPGVRNLTKVAEVLGCSQPNISRWVSRFKWDKRASDYDTWKRSRDEEAHELAARAAIRRVAEAWADHRIAFLDRYMKAHLAMLGKVEEMLKYPISEVEDEVVETYEDGRTRTIAHVHPAKWRARDMALISRSLIASLQQVMEMLEGPAVAAAVGDDDLLDPEEASVAIRAIADMKARKLGIPGPTVPRQPGESRPLIPGDGRQPG